MKITRQTKQISRDAQAFEREVFNKPTPDPLATVAYQGEIEQDAAAELAALSDTFSGRAKIEAKRFELAVDSEYWFCVFFQSREQKERFLQAMDWATQGDKYLNGLALAELQGISIGKRIEMPKPKSISKRMKRLTGGDD